MSGATVMVEAVILQENAWEVLDENTTNYTIFNDFFVEFHYVIFMPF